MLLVEVSILVHSIHSHAHTHTHIPLFFQIDYPSFTRNFYEEHPEITALTKQEIVDLKKKLGIKVCHVLGKIKHIPYSGILWRGF